MAALILKGLSKKRPASVLTLLECNVHVGSYLTKGCQRLNHVWWDPHHNHDFSTKWFGGSNSSLYNALKIFEVDCLMHSLIYFNLEVMKPWWCFSICEFHYNKAELPSFLDQPISLIEKAHQWIDVAKLNKGVLTCIEVEENEVASKKRESRADWGKGQVLVKSSMTRLNEFQIWNATFKFGICRSRV